MLQQQQQSTVTNQQPETMDSVESTAEAPPKQVALAMERLSSAARLIADIRLGADRILEALFVSAQPHQTNKPLHLILKEEASMRQHLQDLRNVGRQLEDSGVLNGSLRSRSNSWGLHMPLVCPDGAVVAYAWKRQLAGQAGASAVDRTRLALKAFTDQKRRFFPHLEDESSGQTSGGESGTSKKHCGLQGPEPILGIREELCEDKTLTDVLMRLEKQAPNVRIFTYQRLDWLKRASSLSSSSNENPIELSKENNFQSSYGLRIGSLGAVAADQVAMIELFVPSVFRAIVSLHPAGSIDPDAVAFFSPDEGGSYIHARGFSVYHVFKHLTGHAVRALQYFLGTKPDSALYLLLHWICSYQTLFTKACSKCRRLLRIDRLSALILPPVHRSYRHSPALKISSIQSTLSTNDQDPDLVKAYHVGCSSDEG
ncbi:Mediator complex [Macleaya cordata]|uniref:Mediator complex n=1 Tax=Macleaya cordata TaxID=56857 RepID=A0A200Q0C9_MACCD|nr:Mediator complex [Macleaya cordata]